MGRRNECARVAYMHGKENADEKEKSERTAEQKINKNWGCLLKVHQK